MTDKANDKTHSTTTHPLPKDPRFSDFKIKHIAFHKPVNLGGKGWTAIDLANDRGWDFEFDWDKRILWILGQSETRRAIGWTGVDNIMACDYFPIQNPGVPLPPRG